tara:strand:- start:899 stop:1420 length:522 start_codon:yes stop_codon:yes gene_type:complete
MNYFYLVSANGVDLETAESYAFDVARENVILCCTTEQPELGSPMTQTQAQQLVNDNYAQWSEFHQIDDPPSAVDMIRYVVKNVDNISIENTINTRKSLDHSLVVVKFEIDLDNLSSLLKVELQAMATTMAISFTKSETKASLIAKINEKTMTHYEAGKYINDNFLAWEGPRGE